MVLKKSFFLKRRDSFYFPFQIFSFRTNFKMSREGGMCWVQAQCQMPLFTSDTPFSCLCCAKSASIKCCPYKSCIGHGVCQRSKTLTKKEAQTKMYFWAGKMAQLLKALSAYPNHLSFISKTHMSGRETTPASCPLTSIVVPHRDTCTNKNVKMQLWIAQNNHFSPIIAHSFSIPCLHAYTLPHSTLVNYSGLWLI